MKQNRYCLIGHPVAQSISPKIHKKLFAISGTDASYEYLDIEPDKFEVKTADLRQYSGFNITIPYKMRIISLLDSVDPSAEKYGAVNTVKCVDGKLCGYNTDVVGFHRAIDSAGIRLAGNVLLCGAGGAAHMMAHEALGSGCSLVVACRTISKARNFADELQGKYPRAKIEISTLAYLSGSFDLILNGTPCGMFPDVKDCPVPLNVARSAGAVFDAVYNPVETALIKTASAADVKVCGGLDMLVWQAAAAQEIWTGAQFSESSVRELCGEAKKLIKAKD